MIHDNKGFLNSPSKLPCYRNIFYISPVASSTFLFFLLDVITCVYTTKTNLLWITTNWTRLLCWWGDGPKRVHRWGWTSRKPSQQTVVGLARPSLSNENLQMVCLVYQLSVGGNWGTCLTLLVVCRKLRGKENKAILSTDYEISTYVCETSF
jgi:hypothetical protein